MRVLLMLVGLLAGCDQLFQLEHVHDGVVDASTGGGDSNGSSDASTDICFGANLGGFKFCFPAATAFPSSLGTTTIDTTPVTGTPCFATQTQPGGPELCIVAAESITISADLRVIGTRPLVLLATGALDISGTVDVSSYRAGDAGAGASRDCNTSGGMTDSGGGGGGAGGTMTGGGGSGGKGSGGASGGAGAGVIVIGSIRGGCSGGDGGGNGAAAGPAGAAGGGAIYLVAGSAITLRGVIRSVGAGGAGGSFGTGGAGGGSGGFVALDAPQVSLSAAARINTRGGGGGEGGPDTGTGFDGFDGDPGTGGISNSSGGDGSSGASGSAGSGGNASGTNSGGGGGGGGGGFIHIYSANQTTATGAVLVPPAP